MKIKNLKLLNFRNYQKKEFQFDDNINIIIGNNGLGKTNIVEAIYYLAITKSFKTNNDRALINEENAFFSIIGEIDNENILNEYKIFYDGTKKKLEINKTNILKISDYISNINIVLFNLDDLKLIKDSPSIRRRLINIDLSQINNNYLILLSKYNRILKQRNMYLKSMMTNGMLSKEYLNIITEKLIEYGIEINKIRKNYFEGINEYLADTFFKINNKMGLKLKYVSQYSEKTKKELINDYDKAFFKDLNYGKTNIGIHLDDFIFYFKDIIIRDFFSEGEQKNAIISLKFSLIEYCINKLKIHPILILDDLFSELDKEKIKNIFKILRYDLQVFITTTDIKIISREIINEYKIIDLNKRKTEALK